MDIRGNKTTNWQWHDNRTPPENDFKVARTIDKLEPTKKSHDDLKPHSELPSHLRIDSESLERCWWQTWDSWTRGILKRSRYLLTYFKSSNIIWYRHWILEEQ